MTPGEIGLAIGLIIGACFGFVVGAVIIADLLGHGNPEDKRK